VFKLFNNITFYPLLLVRGFSIGRSGANEGIYYTYTFDGGSGGIYADGGEGEKLREIMLEYYFMKELL